MTAPSYTTDLTLLDDGETGSWYELTASGWDTGDNPAAETDFFIQGSGCRSSDTNNKTGVCSGVYDAGSDQSGSFSAGDCVFVWHVLLPGNAMNTNANDGIMVVVGASLTAFTWWGVGGRDWGRNPYGGWQNFAVDPTNASGTAVGGGHGGSYRYFGAAADVTSAIAKGTMHGWDVVRYGRGELIIEYGSSGDGYANFADLAAKNDANDATNGYNRWGLFQEQFGTYLWKGLMSIGNSTNACQFVDSNVVITVAEARNTYADFNKIEINHTSTVVDWTGVTILSLFPSGTSPGRLEVVDNADVTMTSCIFTDMDTLKFLSNTVLDTCTFRRCGQVDQGTDTNGGADIDDCTFEESDAAVALYVTNLNNIDNCKFISAGTGHAMELGSDHAGSSFDLYGCTYSGYAASDGSTGNECIYNNSGGAVTINIYGGDTPTIRNGTGASTTVVSGSVTVKVTCKTVAGVNVQNCRVFLAAADGTGPFPYQETVTIVNSGTTATVTHTGHGLATGDYVKIQGASLYQNNGVFQITVTGSNTYTYTMQSSPGSSPTGTIVSTFVALYGLSDANGEVSTSRVYSSDQNVTGWARKSTATPLYKSAPLVGAVDSADGYNSTAVMVLDE